MKSENRVSPCESRGSNSDALIGRQILSLVGTRPTPFRGRVAEGAPRTEGHGNDADRTVPVTNGVTGPASHYSWQYAHGWQS